MWKIAVCDSDSLFADELAGEIMTFYTKRGMDVEMSIYHEGARLLESMDSPKDVVFLNTRLSDSPGFGIAAFLRIDQVIEHPLLVFLSDYKDDMQAAFEYNPVDFINKSTWKKELERAMDRLWVWQHRSNVIELGTKRNHEFVRISDIVYFESDGHYMDACCKDGKEYHFRGRLSDYAERLKDQYFVQLNKSILVNCSYVDRIGNQVIMKDGNEIPYAKARKQKIEEMLRRYVNEMLRRL